METFKDVPNDFAKIAVTDILGKTNTMGNYAQNKKLLLIVNVASSWGLTQTNYKQLQAIYSKYSERGLEILGFPCNQFMNQESGSEAEIKDWVVKEFGVTFLMFSKIMVNGSKTHDLYKYLRLNSELAENGKAKEIPWNFSKFVVTPDGKVLKYYAPKEEPNTTIPLIEQYL